MAAVNLMGASLSGALRGGYFKHQACMPAANSFVTQRTHARLLSLIQHSLDFIWRCPEYTSQARARVRLHRFAGLPGSPGLQQSPISWATIHVMAHSQLTGYSCEYVMAVGSRLLLASKQRRL